MHDLAIRNANVHDGLGNPSFIADVAVDGGRITNIGPAVQSARQNVDAVGLALMPGIIDTHTHYDAQVTWDRTMSPSPALGVTTVVMGNCGFGVAPCPQDMRELISRNLSVVEGMDLKALIAGVKWDFESFPEYMSLLRKTGPYLNTAVFAGHSVIRTAVMGADGSKRVEATPHELLAMKKLLKEAMDAGAIGFATSFSPNHSGYGGIPMPSTIASDAELGELMSVLRDVGRGVFMAAVGTRLTPQKMEKIAAETKRPVYISSILSMYNDGAPDLGITYFDSAAAALDRGNEVYVLTSCQPLSMDFSLEDPYLMYSHTAFEGVQSADPERLSAIYRDKSFRDEFRANLRDPLKGVLFLGNWDHIEVSHAALPKNHELKGRSIGEIARERNMSPLDVFFDIALEEDLKTYFVAKLFQNVDSGVAPQLRHRASVVSLSDAGAHLIYMCDAGFGLHFLAHWVRETGIFTLEEGVRKLTSDPAHRFRIPGRGRLAVGAPADLLLFDPRTVGISPTRRANDLPGGGSRTVRDPVGVHGVWVNGVLIHDGKNYIEMQRGPGHVLDSFYA